MVERLIASQEACRFEPGHPLFDGENKMVNLEKEDKHVIPDNYEVRVLHNGKELTGKGYKCTDIKMERKKGKVNGSESEIEYELLTVQAVRTDVKPLPE